MPGFSESRRGGLRRGPPRAAGGAGLYRGRVRLRFSRRIPAALQQRIRNLWLLY
jgi:hypothetical protein